MSVGNRKLTIMKANELRLGNYVEYQVENYQLASIHSDNTIRLKCDDETHKNYSHGSIGCYGLRELKPIPLTEEWLIKFGFECVDTSDDHHYYLDSKHGFSLNRSFQHLDCEYDLEYVHQLQNLFFALTGEELTINN